MSDEATALQRETMTRLAEQVEQEWLRLPWPAPRPVPPLPLSAGLQTISSSSRVSPPKFRRDVCAAACRAVQDAHPAVVFVVGTSGAGKTTTLRWTARECALQRTSDPSADHPFPIYIDLQRWSIRHPNAGSLAELMEQARPPEAGGAPVLWLLDNADGAEPVHATEWLQLQEEIQSAADSENRFLVAVEDEHALSDVPWSPHVRLKLGGVSARMRTRWLDEHLPEAKDLVEAFAQQAPWCADSLAQPQIFTLVTFASLDGQRPLRPSLASGSAGVLEGFYRYCLRRADESVYKDIIDDVSPNMEVQDDVDASTDMTLELGDLELEADETSPTLEDSRGTEEIDLSEDEHSHRDITEAVYRLAVDTQRTWTLPREGAGVWLKEALPDRSIDELQTAWESAAARLAAAGLLRESNEGDGWEPLHERFVRHGAAARMTRHVREAAEIGSREAAWADQLASATHASLLVESLGMLAVGSEEAAWVEAAYTATRPQGEEAAFRLLARTDNPRALEPVLDAAQSEDAQRRESACVALAQSGFKRASDELRRLCDDSDADVREAARRGLAQVQLRLGRMGRRASRSPLRRVRRIAEKAARRLPRVEHLAQMADLHYQAVDRGYWDRLSGIWDLPKPDQPAVINAHLDDEDRGMRWAAACSLAQRRGAGLLQRLEALMRDREPEIAALAAQAFDHCQSSALWPGLKRAAESPDDHLRNAAVGAMGSLVAQRVIEDLTGRLLPLPGTLRWMRLNLEDESEQRREQALLVDLLKAKNRDVRLAAALRVAELYDSRGFFQLFELQRYRSYTMDGVIYRATSQLRRKPEFSRLLQLLSDGDEMVRGAGVRALGRMGADLMLEQLLDQYRCAGLSPTWDAVRCAVGRVWGWLSGDEEVADLQLGPLPNAGGYGALTLVTVALIVGVVGLLIFVYLMVALGG